MKILPPFFTWSILFLFQLSAHSEPAVNTEDFTSGTVRMTDRVPGNVTAQKDLRAQKKAEKTQIRVERFMHRLEERLVSKNERNGIDNINDPTDKWFWWWAICWGAGILLSILAGGAIIGAGIGFFWWLLFAAGSVALVVWLVKKFG